MIRLRPTFLQGLLIGGGGIAFAFFGCLGAIAGFSSGTSGSQVLAIVGSIAFLAGLIGFLVGAVLFIIATFKALFGKRDEAA